MRQKDNEIASMSTPVKAAHTDVMHREKNPKPLRLSEKLALLKQKSETPASPTQKVPFIVYMIGLIY